MAPPGLQGTLLAGDPSAGADLGRAVAVCGDVAVVGAPALDVGPKQEAGAVYVFVRSTEGRWTAQARLTALDGVAWDNFGRAVDVFGDTVLVGAPYHDVAGKDGAGAVYVFKRTGGSWVQQDKLIAADATARAGFGASLAIDDESVVIGSPWHDRPGRVEAGAAYVFTRSGDTWRQQGQLLAADGTAADYFGHAVDLQRDLALVGAPGRDNGPRVDAGGAYTFERSGAVWTQQDVLVAVNGPERIYFGRAVAVAGHTALVGAPAASVPGAAEAGAVYVFWSPVGVWGAAGDSWAEQAKLVAGDATAEAWFGYSVSMDGQSSSSDELALIGAPSVTAPLGAGAAYVFANAAGGWAEQKRLVNGLATRDAVGYSVDLSGATSLLGAPYHQVAGLEHAGAAYVFISAPAIHGLTPSRGPVGTPVTIAGSGFAGATAVSFNGTPATYTVDSDAQITTAVPFGATSGPVTVTNRAGSTASATSFTVIPAPTMTGFTPSSGVVGTPVTITGTGFMWASAVTFNGTDAAFEVEGGDIVTSVPAGATSGPLAVTTDGGTVVSASDFTVIAVPVIARLGPTSGKRGATVTIIGAGFGATRSGAVVKFGGKTCGAYLSWSDARIKCKVPRKATYGRVRVTVVTGGGVSDSKNFRVKR